MGKTLANVQSFAWRTPRLFQGLGLKNPKKVLPLLTIDDSLNDHAPIVKAMVAAHDSFGNVPIATKYPMRHYFNQVRPKPNWHDVG